MLGSDLKHLIKELNIAPHTNSNLQFFPNMESVARQIMTDIVIDCNDGSNSNQPGEKTSNPSQSSRTRLKNSIQQIKQNQRNIVIFLIFLIVTSDLLTRLLKSGSVTTEK